jgi:hypothetical protein
LEKKLEEQSQLLEGIGAESVCNKYSDLLKDLNGIQKQKNSALMNYLRMKSREAKK